MAATRLAGTISRLVEDRGFGFIIGPDSATYFFHQSDLGNCSIRELKDGDAVSFLAVMTPKGARAEDVTRTRR